MMAVPRPKIPLAPVKQQQQLQQPVKMINDPQYHRPKGRPVSAMRAQSPCSNRKSVDQKQNQNPSPLVRKSNPYITQISYFIVLKITMKILMSTLLSRKIIFHQNDDLLLYMQNINNNQKKILVFNNAMHNQYSYIQYNNFKLLLKRLITKCESQITKKALKESQSRKYLKK